jgi:replicative DNA helicase
MNDSLNNPEAEQSVLGGLLLDPERIEEVSRVLNPADFSDQQHRTTFEILLSMHHRGTPVDEVTVAAALKQQSTIPGPSVYVATLLNYVPTAVNILAYCQLVKEAATRRHLAETGRKLSLAAVEAESIAEAIDSAEAAITGLRGTSGDDSCPKGVSQVLGGVFKELDKRRDQVEGLITGVPTGLPDLDEMTAGFHPGDLIIVAGRPSMGKTAFALNISQAGAQAGYRVLIFSLEMSKEQLVSRLLAATAGVNAQRLRTGLQDEDWPELRRASEEIHKLPIQIDDASSQTIYDIRSKARRVQKDGGLGLIVIDYLQLMKPVKSYQQREREVAEISRGLKGLARELSVPVVVLAQLNRGVETGATPRRPIPSDLRESGALEQDSDVILFPWREAAYCSDCRRKNADCGKGHFRAAEIIVGKQRNGPVGSVPAIWLPELTRFEPMAAPYREVSNG